MVKIKFRHTAFKLIAITIPLLFFVFLELVLRLFHYGYSTRLLVEDSDGMIHLNTKVSRTFFSNQQDARLGVFSAFKKDKSHETVRIFVLGESSALGYPYTLRGSFPRMLTYRLERTFPGKNIEIINLSITAINSFAIMTFAREIVDMDPDAVLIYAGHNEYYGALGAGSAHFIGNNRNMVKLIILLKRFRVVQLAFDGSFELINLFRKDEIKHPKGFMQRMAAEQEIRSGSQQYHKGIEQFKYNMQEMLEDFNSHHIPVYLSNLVSNEKGQKPFISMLLDGSDSTAFFKAHRSGMNAYHNQEYTQALHWFKDAYKIDSTYAMNLYMIGEVLYQRSDFTNACRFYSKAKEHDALRFRAPEAINYAISGFCDQFSNVHFVDSESSFRNHSSNQIPDDKLFMDHLHPNLFGYYLISDAFYNSILETQLIHGKVYPSTFDKIWNEIPLTIVDSIYGDWMCLVMKEQWPFYEHNTYVPDTKNYPERLTMMIFNNQISYNSALDSLFYYYLKTGNKSEAIKVAQSVGLEYPYDTKLSERIAQLFLQDKNYDQSVFYYKKAFGLQPGVETGRKIVLCLLQLDQPEESLKYLAYLRQNDPNDNMSIDLLAKVSEVIRLKVQYTTEPDNIQVINRLVAYYLYTGNMQEAKKFIDRAMVIEPGNWNSNEYLKTYNASNDHN